MRVMRTFSLAFVTVALLWASTGRNPLALDVNAQAAADGTEAAPAAPAAGAPAVEVQAESVDAATASTSPENLDDVYNLKLHGIEERVNGLKEEVFRSKARLLLLRETVLHGVVSGAKGILYHINELGAEYAIESVTYFLDGLKIYSRTDNTGELARKTEFKIYEGNLTPGNHQVNANVVLHGNGFGIFSYLNSYTLKVQGSYSFIAQEGKVTRLKIIIYERGGLRQDFTDRPYFRYEVQTDRNLPTDESSI